MRFFYSCLLVMLITVQANAQYTMNGSALLQSSTSTATYIQLTPSDFYRAGSFFKNNTINLSQDFEINTKLYFGTSDAGADGLAFVLQPSGTTYIGHEGAGLGYHRFNGTFPSDIPADVPGPVPSFIIEFDTWRNVFIGNQNIADPADDHVAFMSHSNAYHTSTTALQSPQLLSANIEDGQWHDAKFTWNATMKQMTVQFTTTSSPQIIQTFSYTGDIVNTIFGGNPVVYWGFTAGTGSFSPNEHAVAILQPATCGQLRTQTPGGWGAPPNGNNPGRYLHDHFSAAFPAGLKIGLDPNFHALFTSAQSITDYLPAGGTPSKLTANYINPSTNALKNTLVSHILALSLSVGFDDADPSFGAATITLGDMKIGSGAFAGWTVRAFLSEANKVLGNGTSSYSVQQVLETASGINENYVDGSSDKGYLTCPVTQQGKPAEEKPVTMSPQHQFNMGPNPAYGYVDVQIPIMQGSTEVIITNTSGKIVERRRVSSGTTVQRFNLQDQPSGIYLVRITNGNSVAVQKLVIQR